MLGHPVATVEQHEHEKAALELWGHPVVAQTRETVRADWLEKEQPSGAMADCFEWAFEEVMFSAAVWSSNQDPLRPKVTCITRLEHEIEGMRIPGSRWGIDNPDSIYRVIPISGSERYEIRGRVGAHRMTENYFTLWDDSMGTEALFNGHDLVTDSDGSFVISVDASPAAGRPNHVQSTERAHEFYIRDVMLDWAVDDPNWLEIDRLGGSPSVPPLTLDQQARRTAEYMVKFAEFTQGLSKGMMMGKPNRFHLAYSADKGGALRNQVYVGGHFLLEDDEAFVIDINDGGARYFTVPISNVWGTTMGIMDRTGSLNKAQSEPNPDGSWTFVLANSDPGVHNWVDPCGLPSGIVTLRMAEFPGQRPREDLAASGRVVKLADLESALPAGTREVGAEERATQLARAGGGVRSPAAGGPAVSRWLITGCSTGIGRAIALAALEAGHSVLVTARQPDSVKDLVDAYPGTAASSALDVTDRAQIEKAVAHADTAFGGVDVLVNNAGYGYLSAVEEGDDAEVRALFDTNFFGALDMIKAVLPGMRTRGVGHIVNVSSMTGIVTNPPNTYYSCTKHALEALTEGLAKEVAPFGIKVTAIEPGAFRTDYITRSMHRAEDMTEYAEISERKEVIAAFGEYLPGDPAKLAAAVLEIVGLDDPPLRLLLGRDALHAFNEKMETWTASVRTWEQLSTAMEFD